MCLPLSKNEYFGKEEIFLNYRLDLASVNCKYVAERIDS